MARRIVNGNAYSEDGWPIVDQGSCTWVNIIGTENGPQGTVRLQLQNGPPLIVLSAFAADFHVNIEPLRDNDSAAWTSSNSVLGQPGRNNGSNHLGATGMDLNWDGPPEAPAFRYGISKERAYPGDKARRLDELMAFWAPVIFCGGNWSNHDWMHFQCAAGTYDQHSDQPTAKILDFIRDNIRPDGRSTYKRGGAPGAPVPPKPAEPTNASRAISILSRATGVTADKAQEILVGVVNGLRDSQCDNVNRIAMWLAQIGHESAGFNATEEYQNGDESTDRWKYKGRTWIQITWRSNYDGLSRWAFGKGLIPSPTYFVDNPRKLAEIQYAGLGPAWYWTVARPQINSLCDARNLTAVTQAINGGQNGAADRKSRYDRALTLGDQLLVLTNADLTPGDDFMSALSEPEQRELYDLVRWLAAPGTGELRKQFPSRSAVRSPNEGLVDTAVGMELNTDGNVDFIATFLRAALKFPPAIERLKQVADGVEAGRSPLDSMLAQAMLADAPNLLATTVVASVVDKTPAPAPAPQVVYVDRPVPAAAEPAPAAPPADLTPGQVIGAAYDALQALQLSGVLDDAEKATLGALQGVLNQKLGASA